MFCYRVYGLSIRSDLVLPGLVEEGAAPEVEVRLRRLPAIPAQAREQGCYFQASGPEAYLYWDDVGALLVRGGREILVDPLPEAAASEVRLGLLGPALAVLLHQRGRTPLHASGVAMGAGAVVFLGDPGLGKSTTAAAFFSRGYPLLADDLIALSFDPLGQAFVSPGFPGIRLSPQAAAFLGWDLEAATTALPEDKYICPAERDFPQQALPLKVIYVLARGRKLEIRPLEPQQALIELIRHTYRLSLMHPIKGSANFLNCAALAKRLPIRRLRIPRALTRLPDVVQAVENDLAGLPLKPEASWKAEEVAEAHLSP